MPKGGRRPGAGAKKGSKHKTTLAKAAAYDAYCRAIDAHFAEVVAAQVASAVGDYMLLEPTKDGFREVTDKGHARQLLATGRALRVALRPGQPAAQKDILDRRTGKPKEQVELSAAPEGVRVVHEVVIRKRGE